MGLFNRNKNKKDDIHSFRGTNPQRIDKSDEVRYGCTSDGRLQVDFYDSNADFKQFYDTTRLIANGKPMNIEGHFVYNCIVSWYGSDDCQYIDTSGKKNGRRTDYKGVLAEIDLKELNTNPEYCRYIMTKLLEQKRVEKYLEKGLEETPDVPCGKYIGGVEKEERGYKKVFSREVGRASHNSSLMVNRRSQHREEQGALKQQQIARLQDQIDRLR